MAAKEDREEADKSGADVSRDEFSDESSDEVQRVTRRPRPGQGVRGSRTGRPIMALLDLLGQRWILRILWELRGEPLGFRELQLACDGMSPSVLSERLRELRDANIVRQDERGAYTLSPRGRELFHALAPLQQWADEWTTRLAKDGPARGDDAVKPS